MSMTRTCGAIVIWSREGPRAAPKRSAASTVSPAAELASLVDARQIYTASQVDVTARQDSAKPVRPQYPDALYDAQVSGTVMVEFIVTAMGEVDADRMSVVFATHPAFVESVRQALESAVYVPALQSPSLTVFLMARASGNPETLVPGLRAAIARVDPAQPAYDIAAMPDALRERTTGVRFIGGLMAAFGVLAMVLATFGIYGVMSHYVAQRRSEIGVRMALGATKAAVFRLVLEQALRLVVFGVAAGLAAAAAATRQLGSLLFQTEALDPLTFAATALVLVIVAAVASYLPAWRGTRITPTDALRAQ